jgi:hypothetical protein
MYYKVSNEESDTLIDMIALDSGRDRLYPKKIRFTSNSPMGRCDDAPRVCPDISGDTHVAVGYAVSRLSIAQKCGTSLVTEN